jgi:DNA-binding NarL/FixJ family response regulator
LNIKLDIIVVDDFELSRMGIRYMLHKISYISSIREASDSTQLFNLLSDDEPDVIFMDVNLENESGIDVTKKVLQKYPDTYIIALTASKDIQYFIEMVDAGVTGFLLKNITQDELEKALEEILAGRVYYSKEFITVAKQLLPSKNKRLKIRLSDREKQVLKLICMGYSNQDIAKELDLSSHTIDTHRKKLIQKMGAKNTASMIAISISEGLVDLE